MDQWISWVATTATIIAACMTASNLGTRITGSGFIVFTIGSIAWIAVALTTGQSALLWTNIVLTFLNLFGIWRWLGRQARIEEGGEAAQKRSRAAQGETLFPVSLLSKAGIVAGDGSVIGRAVDAMAGCSSGAIRYLVVSEGGIAGVGETLRRLDWDGLAVEGDAVRCRLSSDALCSLEAIEPGQWPAR
jgi:hypothetical protein